MLHSYSGNPVFFRRHHMQLAIVMVLSLMLFSSLVSAVERKNGFDVSNALIDVDQILSGGPKKDGIPAIDKPKFVAAKHSDFLSSNDRVLGVVIDGVAKAYPIKILNWHEIVNDRIRGNAFVVTYCPLCGTGVAFWSNIRGQKLKFGVSGLLYNSDVLFYDRQTESLWSQIASKAISGKLAGAELEQLVLAHTTWSDWLEKHPRTLVLSTKTGYLRSYNANPYAGYEQSRNLYFEVNHKAPKSYHPKERVLGLNASGVYKAYPFVELNKQAKSQFVDVVNEKSFTILWDQEHQSGSIMDADGNAVPVMQAFWFAWFGFHPQTEVFQAK